MDRKAVFAGRFYPGTANSLNKELNSYTTRDEERIKAIGVVSPHAGYMYSGKVAGAVFSKVVLPQKYIILSPNHTGLGAGISLFEDGQWETPLGKIDVDADLAESIMEKFDKVKPDASAHMMEHSLEVQLPFIQYFKKDFKFVPITISHISCDDCKRLGTAIAQSVKGSREDILVVASSDMTHYESAREAEKKDRLAVDRIEKLDPEGLFNTVRENGISMCGVIPVTVMLYSARELGAKKGTLVKYSNSGEASGDLDEVVGYASMYVS